MKAIETERLIIDYGHTEDYVKVHEFDFNYLQDIEGIFKYVKRDPNQIRRWFKEDSSIKDQDKKSEEENAYYFIIYLKESNEPIGDIGFDRYDDELNSLEISCWLHPNYWGNGYAQEALIGAMKYIFSLGYDNIIYGYYEGNKKSKRNCEKIGFKFIKNEEENNFLGNKIINHVFAMSKEEFYKLYKSKTK